MADELNREDVGANEERPSDGWESAADRRGRRERKDSSRRSDDARAERRWEGRQERRGAYRDERRGEYRDDRRGGYREDRRSERRWEDRGERRGGYRDDRRGGYRDDRGERRGGYRDGWRDERRYRDDRGGRRWEDRGERRWEDRSERRWEDRGERRGGYREDRRGGYRDDRSERRGGYRDGWRDERRYRDDRGGRRWEDREERRGEYRDDRRGGYRDDRGGRRWEDRGERRESYRDERRGAESRSSRQWEGREERRGGYRNDDSRTERRGDTRDTREGASRMARGPEIPESVSARDLDAEARGHLRSLNKENADRVARHLVYAGSMMDENPELAYEHAQAAYRRAPRIDVVREALGVAAYLTGRYSEALRELRTYRRMTDDYSHVAIEADSERGLGRPEKALRFIDEVPLKKLDAESTIELALVKSGARADTGDFAGGLEVLERINVDHLDEELRARIELIRADRYDELGRADEAQALREKWEPIFEGNGEVDYFEEDTALPEPAEADEANTEGTASSEWADVEDEWADVEDIDDEDWPERAELEAQEREIDETDEADDGIERD